MRSTKKWAPSLALILSFSSAYATNYEIDKHWNVLAEYVLMRRSEISHRKLINNAHKLECDKGCLTHTVVDTNDLVNGFDFESGGRLGLAYVPDTKSIYEASFMYLWPWEHEKVAHGNNSLYFPSHHHRTFTDDYVDAEEAKAFYKTRFYTFELNYWRNSNRRNKDYFVVSGIFGIRYVHVQEKFNMPYYNTEEVFFTSVDKSNYNTRSRNDMIGIQGGAALQMNPLPYFSIDFSGKGGLGLNRAQAKVLFKDDNNTVIIRDYEKVRWQDCVFAEAAAKIGYQVVSCLNLHAGYQMLYVSGLALAPEQVSYSSNPSNERFITHGFVIIHGMMFGFNLTF